jgi:YD repeat-containing protein
MTKSLLSFNMLKFSFNLRIVATIVACLAAAMVLFSGCEKDNDPDNPDNPTNPTIRLVVYLYDAAEGSGTYNYEYDNQNRLTKITATGGEHAGVWTVTYPSSTTARYVNASDNMLFTKNNQGYTVKYEANVKGVKVNQDLEYTDGYLTKTTNEIAGVTIINTYVWSNGKLDALEMRMPLLPTPVEKAIFAYTTTPNKECSISPWTISHDAGNWMCPASWAGKMSPNLVSSKTTERLMMGSSTTTYRYETDEQGYVTKVYAKEGAAAEFLLYEFKYK